MPRVVKPSDHFDGKRFFNPAAPQAFGFGAVWRWKLSSRPAKWQSFYEEPRYPAPPRAVDGTGIPPVCLLYL